MKVKIKDGVKITKTKEVVCGPFGSRFNTILRSCPHNFVHPKDWSFVDVDSMTVQELNKYLCPNKCFTITF